MSISQLDTFFPFDQGQGLNATMPRWRLMARLWYGSGVVPTYLNQFQATLAGGVLTIQPGGAWIDGFYGETTGNKTLAVGTGLVVARMDPTGRQIIFAYKTGSPTQLPVQNLNDIFEIPLWSINGTTLTDARQFANAVPGKVARARAWRSAPYTSLNTGYLAFDQVSYGTGFSTGTYTCPYAADFLVIAQWGCTSQSTAFWMETNIVHNGASAATSGPNTAPTLIGLDALATDVIACNAGDTLRMQMLCNANGYTGAAGINRSYMSVRALQ